ncbi:MULTISPECIES: isopentenyl-diphosphate Delta-isomerase [Micrococcaceae]|uniref:isopentenyl-diphosphate Delta-isomerase n=1 Tax=Micrococcaceae TaxID=1268 RepID=UPI0016177915|nr:MULTISPECIES: isopentenyl-diphosphate Delta-isomerase [Micrococcaceae]MBB5749870.1 isopentenyl-diphosphate delta-isomerase [Micrococcus sp. TA1]HRO29247.1 isopentenyl-diphosphate Delta-isomerase [Citricoccus sp.]HRO92720.1 isopentenyl-diphosphate Delta-isomerase [Citricoccus sp.]
MEQTTDDHVILVDDEGRTVGLAPRATVHDESTPLHRAFSCYVYRDDGHVLVTRRALSKRAWPGVWTNSFCGHPRQDEDGLDTVNRYARHELGLVVEDVRCVLPDFRYRAVDASGIVENELCPVYVARAAGAVQPNPEEAMEHRWVSPQELERWVGAAPWSVSPWLVEQLPGVLPVLAGGVPQRGGSGS